MLVVVWQILQKNTDSIDVLLRNGDEVFTGSDVPVVRLAFVHIGARREEYEDRCSVFDFQPRDKLQNHILN